MSSVVISGDTSGTVSLTVPAVAGTNTATLPAATGTVMVSGNMPTFSYYSNAGVTVSSGGFTKVTFTVSEWDTTGGMYASSRFTPTVAGYYQIDACVACSSTVGGQSITSIYKNGSEFKRGNQVTSNITGTQTNTLASALIYFNGSTDYIEIYVYQSSGVNQTTGTGQAQTYFQGAMVRTA
jgi:hypothetical protein